METQTVLNSRLNQGLISVVLGFSILALGAYAYLTVQQAQYVSDRTSVITVTGVGEILAVPDIGTFSFSVIGNGETATEAQADAALRNNEIVAYLAEAGVAESDVRTNYYNLNPRYSYSERACPAGGFCPPGERVLTGYEVRQGISVMVRDTSEAGQLISGVGERGADDISGLQFTIDDETELQDEARAAAIADAKERAAVLAGELGVSLVRVIDYYEDNYGYQPPYGMAERSVLMSEDMAVTPDMPVGENTIRQAVTLVYEVR